VTPTVCPSEFRQVLILDGEPQFNRLVLEVLAQRGVRGTVAGTERAARRLLGQCVWNLIFYNPSIEEDTESPAEPRLLREIRRQCPETPIIAVSERDSSEEALRLIRLGCTDFLSKPISGERLADVLASFLPIHPAAVMASFGRMSRPLVMIGQSRRLEQVLAAAVKAAGTSASILICGESGTGKELLAHFIHNQSRRCHGPFIRVNCAALAESLLESELFGHEKGAFTGALFSRRGCFERADGGTLLLDEITETPPAFQAKLLRVLEEMSFERVGGGESIQVNVRILSTTNQDILRRVQEGQFRADLYYRLAGVRLTMPALRERMEDLPSLIWFFVNQFAPETGRRIEGIERETLDLFEQYSWPGNIRQLRNVVRTALILGEGPLLSVTGLPTLMEELRSNSLESRSMPVSLKGYSLEEVERQAILAVLERTGGNQSEAARVLGISDRTLRERIRKYRQQEEILATG
jgi:DNA-binding NtrC family response regulator